MDDDYVPGKALAVLFQRRRIELGLSYRELASLLNTSVSQVQRVCTGEGNLTLTTVCRVADALDLDVRIDIQPKHAQLRLPFEEK